MIDKGAELVYEKSHAYAIYGAYGAMVYATPLIGGLIAENTIENKKYIPVLHSLPFLGRFFQSTAIEKEQRELLIFITPSIIG